METLVLLPTPRALVRLEGAMQWVADRLVCLEGFEPADRLRVGRALQTALSETGIAWELTAARGADGSRLGMMVRIDPAAVAQREGYRLLITPQRIEILAHDAAGAFYAAQTLRQLARQSAGGGILPCLRVEDWPDFPARSVMLDISRTRVPTMPELYRLIDLLAEWKINQFQLYTEHTFAYRDHREVWQAASPMTAQEILELDAYCRDRFIELVPNQNSFGHVERWLKHPRYAHLAEMPPREGTHGSTLCPIDPNSVEFLAGLYDELLPHFSSHQFNVGCDETWDLGKGRSKEACEHRGPGRVYLDFLKQIHRLVHAHGRTMQFWGDIILQHPELIRELPQGIIALDWGYEANHPFDEQGRKFAESGVPFYVCPGTSAWLTLIGRTDNALGNLCSAAENGLKHGAVGYLNTNWGDCGNWEHLPISLLGYAAGAAFSWSLAANRDLDLPAALDRHAFHDSAGVMGRLVHDLGNAYRTTGREIPNNSVLSLILRYPETPTIREKWFEGTTAEGLKEAGECIEQSMQHLPNARMQRPDAALIIEELRNDVVLALHAVRQGIARLNTTGGRVSDIPQAARRELAEDLERIVPDYRRLWRARSREGGLAESASVFDNLLRTYGRTTT